MKFSQQSLLLVILLSLTTACSSTKDLGHSLQGDVVQSEVETIETDEVDPFFPSNKIEKVDAVEEYAERKSDSPFVASTVGDQNIPSLETSNLKDFTYLMPGSGGTSEYEPIDAKKHAKEFYNQGEQTIHLTYYKNTFNYKSPNDVINRTIGNGFQNGKFGPLTIKNDRYLFRTAFLNGFYAIGAGVSFSRGKGLFIDGTQSSTTFKFWEIPIDAGLGVELPFGPWISLRALGGGTLVGLYQSRDDFSGDEKGKKRVQYGYGPFAEGNVRFNLSRLFPETAFEYFSQSEMTNISVNASLRYQNYSRFKDDITISGTSFGLGFGFEFL